MRLFVVLLISCYSVSVFSQQSALSVVEKAEGGDEDEVVTADEDEDVVQPTAEWQTLRPGQAVPAGSHVRLNLQTGQREVRLGDEQLKYWSQKHRETSGIQSSFTPEELKRAMKKMKEDVKPERPDQDQDQDQDPDQDQDQDPDQDQQDSRFRPLEELKRDLAQLDLLVETDVQVMRRLLDQFNASESTMEQKLSILLELEYLVHQVDNAQTLCSMGGLQLVLDGLNSSDFRLQENSAFVLGSAVSSNPQVQVQAVEGGALQTLLTSLASDQPLNVKKKVLFAVASLLRNFPHAQRHFLSRGGLQVLSELFRADGGGVLRTRVVTLVYDMISEKELVSQAGLDLDLDLDLDPVHEERVRQYEEVSLQEELEEDGWCLLVPTLLDSTEHDHREKALRALLAMTPVCLDQFRSDRILLDSLDSLRVQYQDLVRSEMVVGDEDGYYEDILDLIESLRTKITP